MKGKDICVVGGEVYTPGRVIDGGLVVVRGGVIAAVGERGEVVVPPDAEIVDATGRRVMPGLIDLHLHGIMGEDVADGDITTISLALARQGVTAFVATVAAAPQDELIKAIERLAASAMTVPRLGGSKGGGTRGLGRVPGSETFPGLPGARMVGIHLEGPFVSARRAGALNPKFFRPPSQKEAEELLRAGRGNVRVVTIAPELAGAQELIAWLAARGVAPSVGHSDATFQQVAESVGRGLCHATHTFNAMRPFHHREPGVVGAVLAHDGIVAEVIADGHHVHPAALSLLFRIKGADRVCLVSDAAPLAGLPSGTYDWLNQKVTTDGLAARLQDGMLAGSVAPLNVALRRLAEAVGIPVATALKTASSTPARVLSRGAFEPAIGSIEVGKEADIAVFDEAFQCHLTMVKGTVVHRA